MDLKQLPVSEKRALRVGSLIQNLRSLEVSIRVALFCCCSGGKVPHMTSVVEGEEVEENFITDYSNLGELLEKVNKILPEAKKLDKERHVRVRDAFAHGRLLSETPDGVPTLVKFSKGHDRRVRVEFAQKLSDEWLAAEINFVGDSVRTIHEHLSSTSGPT